jgi:hypothetical protein
MVMNHWSDEIEEICERLRVNCVNLSEYHRRRYYHFKSYGKWFRLPVIILASINSTASVGLQPVLEQQIISGITCLIGMIMGIIGSLELYLGIQTSMELELKQSKEFYTLAINLYKTLALKRENRLDDGKEFLNDKYSLYTKLCESSNLLDTEMHTDLLAKVPEGMKYTSKVRSKNKPRDLDIQSIKQGALNLEKLKVTIPEIHDGDDSPLMSKHHLAQEEIPLNNISSFKNVENDIENAVKTEENKIKKTEIVLDSSDNAIV